MVDLIVEQRRRDPGGMAVGGVLPFAGMDAAGVPAFTGGPG
jgi:hypothetical protein